MILEPIIPDYTGACLSNVIPAFLEHKIIGSGWIPEEILNANQVVILLIDGLGFNQFQEAKHSELTPNLAKMKLQKITTVAPSTTATALTSLTTGKPPGEHGIVGYKINVGNQLLNSLRWTTGRGVAVNDINPISFQPVTPFIGEKIPVISPIEFSESGFTSAHLRGADYLGYSMPSNMPQIISNSISQGYRLVYSYYDGLDKVGHIHGLGTYFNAEIAMIDFIVGQILETLPSKTGLLVTADHGMVNVGNSVIQINSEILQQTNIISGEARFLWFHPTRGCESNLLTELDNLYSEYAWVRSKEQILDEGWFGRQVSAQARERLGEIALLAREPVAFIEKDRPGPKLIGRHGSLTEAEMYVPLITAFKD